MAGRRPWEVAERRSREVAGRVLGGGGGVLGGAGRCLGGVLGGDLGGNIPLPHLCLPTSDSCRCGLTAVRSLASMRVSSRGTKVSRGW